MDKDDLLEVKREKNVRRIKQRILTVRRISQQQQNKEKNNDKSK